ncbi:uncharacterized protein UV8b_05925 [Ustilaginoidea virens]|uniref:Glutamine synthetase n=1 Tax=Ustilaginoidea virens TaxID=1159556 RepID=A0A063BXC7_USTVR|nr:uncharacterized protein UV8b_05925 [Ustilaginoidea virens]QUC21682.1 hypothetical protein UV8b_05925 [Ustilaginoidea virens]GAO18813.1 hypothetical protein UVI_02014960 [Ustilaginoidea virens]
MTTGFEAAAKAFRQLIHATPIIDHHAHPLLKKSQVDQYPLLAIATEARGEALESSRTSLAHIRAVKQLSKQLGGCDATWEAVERAVEQRRRSDYEEWTRACLSGIQCVLVDDGLDNEEAVESYSYFDRFTPSPSKRIVRIEQVAACIFDKACLAHDSAASAFQSAISSLETVIQDAIADHEVVGFKSVICYRTGLDIAPKEEELGAREAFAHIYAGRRREGASRFARIQHRPLNELIVHRLAQLIRDSSARHKKPVQFHTGLGDNDLTLTRASPAHLQDFAREYPQVPLVLLHSGYPFERELGYMAATYANVYADIGEVFPFVSRGGQESILRHILELCPWEKVIWSTDGHWFPETYLLSVAQMREAFCTVLCDLVQKGDVSWSQAARLVQDVLFNTSNRIYNLGLAGPQRSSLQEAALDEQSPPSNPTTACEQSKKVLDMLSKPAKPQYLHLCWVDYTGTLRLRVIPSRRAEALLKIGAHSLTATVTKAALGLLQNDTCVADVGPSGLHVLHPDMSSARHGPREHQLMMMCDFKEEDGSTVGLCPRSILRKAVDRARQENLELLLGFEIELVLVGASRSEHWPTLDSPGHAWSSSRAMDHEVVHKVLEPAVEQLEQAGVHIEMLHAESANGQFEVILAPYPPLEAVDTLLFARQVLSACAAAHGYKMTLHPKPVADGCGTAAHAHVSLRCADTGREAAYEAFYAGILAHLRAICAFTYSNMASYERVQDGCWAGGTWVAWGTQNRETPLRKIKDSHWEVKCIDGLANPYLAVAALMLAGVNGVAKEEKLVWGDCTKDPATLFWEERLNLGINSNLPANIEEALVCLMADDELTNLLGEDVVNRYVAVKKAETRLLKGMGANDRKRWIMDRY